jgi:hypothetical protein
MHYDRVSLKRTAVSAVGVRAATHLGVASGGAQADCQCGRDEYIDEYEFRVKWWSEPT